MEKSTFDRCISAAKRYLELTDHEILVEFEEENVVVYIDGDDIVFAEIRPTDEGVDADLPPMSRHEFEKLLMRYFVEYDGPEGVIRNDVIQIHIIGPSKAIVKHHKNAVQYA